MGFYLQIDDAPPSPIASLTGWGDVIRWSDKLPPAKASALHHLVAFGWEDDAAALKSQLADNFKATPPHDSPTKETLRNFSALLNAHTGKITVVSVTDGLGKDSEEGQHSGMGIEGFNTEKCQQRNRLAAKRDDVDAVPMHFFRDAPVAPESSTVKTRGYLPTTPGGILSRINASRPSEGSAPLTESDIYFHFAEAANSSFVADRYCFLDKTTLQNIAADAEAGFAFMNSHRTGGMSSPTELPFGKTFGGQYQEWTDAAGNTQRRALVGVYMLRGKKPNGDSGPSTDDLHAMIDGGTVADVSVGLKGGDYVCDVCGHDLSARDPETRDYLCPHAPGTTRRMNADEQTAQKARGVSDGASSYSLVGARCGELSAVYDGAVPGAGFRKTLSLSRAHALSAGETNEARRAYFALMGKGDFEMDDIEERAQHGVMSALRSFFGTADTAPAAAPAVIPAASVQQHPVLTAALAAGIDTPEKLAALQARSTDGDTFTTVVSASLGHEAVRLFGAEAGKKHADASAHLPVSAQMDIAKSWQVQADDKFRIGKNGQERAAASRETAPPDDAAALSAANPNAQANPDDVKFSLEQSSLGTAGLAATK